MNFSQRELWWGHASGMPRVGGGARVSGCSWWILTCNSIGWSFLTLSVLWGQSACLIYKFTKWPNFLRNVIPWKMTSEDIQMWPHSLMRPLIRSVVKKLCRKGTGWKEGVPKYPCTCAVRWNFLPCWRCSGSLLSRMTATGPMELWSAWNVASVSRELNFKNCIDF